MLDLLSASAAWAQTGDEESVDGFASILSSPLIMIVLMFVVFYFMLIRPQQRKNKETKNMLSSLQKGDEVVTSGGIYGRITGLSDTQVVIEIAPQVRVKIHRPSVVQKLIGGSAEAEKK